MLNIGLLLKFGLFFHNSFYSLWDPCSATYFSPNYLGSRTLEIFFTASKRVGVSQQRDPGDTESVLKVLNHILPLKDACYFRS